MLPQQPCAGYATQVWLVWPPLKSLTGGKAHRRAGAGAEVTAFGIWPHGGI